MLAAKLCGRLFRVDLTTFSIALAYHTSSLSSEKHTLFDFCPVIRMDPRYPDIIETLPTRSHLPSGSDATMAITHHCHVDLCCVVPIVTS